jgi:hypothetical protein
MIFNAINICIILDTNNNITIQKKSKNIIIHKDVLSEDHIKNIVNNFGEFPDDCHEKYNFLNNKIPTLDAILQSTNKISEDDMYSIRNPNQPVHDSIIFNYVMHLSEIARSEYKKKIVVVHPLYFAR